jgi:hypothetical protein
MQYKNVEEWIESLSKKNTKKVTGSIHQKELKERNFINGILKGMKLSIKDNPDASDTKVRLRLQKVLGENCRDNGSSFHVKTFDLDGFLMSLKKAFDINVLKNGV